MHVSGHCTRATEQEGSGVKTVVNGPSDFRSPLVVYVAIARLISQRRESW